MKAIFWNDETLGAEYEIEEIPAELKKKANAFRNQMVETIVENERRRADGEVHRRREDHAEES